MKKPILAWSLVALSLILVLGAVVFLATGARNSATPAPFASAAAQLLLDGSFETPVAVKEYDTFTPGSKLGPWSIGGGPVDLVGKYWKAAKGTQSINLRGGETRPWIWQDVKTEPGRMYTLKFALSGNPDGAPRDKKIEIWWDDQLIDTVTFGVESISHPEMGWKYITYNITAVNPTTRLKFSSGVDQPWGPALDDVTLTEMK